MGKLREATPITIFPPTSGVNRKDPLANMGQAYSPWLLNVDCEPQSIKVRNGYVIHSVVGSSSIDILNLGGWAAKGVTGIGQLFAYVDDGSLTHKIYDVTSAIEVLNDTAASDTADIAKPINFNGRLIFLTENATTGNRTFTYPTWADSGWTLGGTAVPGYTGVSFKQRFYSFKNSLLHYGGVEAVTGPMTEVDYQSFFEANGTAATISWAAVLGSPGERSGELYLAFGNFAGEVLVFSGDYPDSPTWEIIGRFNIGASLGFSNNTISFNNDVWILTATGIVSLRGLFTNGERATLDLSVSVNINDYFTRLINNITQATYTLVSISCCYWPERNQILILVPGHIDKNGTYSSSAATMCAFNTINNAWSFHKLTNVDTTRLGGLTYFNGNVYFFTQNTIMKSSLTGYKDEQWDSPGSYSSYDFEIQGAYSSFGDETRNKRCVAIEPNFKTDFNGTHVGVQAVADFGRQVSDVAEVELIDGYNLPYYSVGAQGVYLQYRIVGESDTASTDGFELFATSMILSPGGTR